MGDAGAGRCHTAGMDPREQVERFSPHNYHPLPVVLASGEGAWVTDVDGNRYLDLLSAYSALNFGHLHPRLVAVAKNQLDRLTLTSRAFHNDQLGPFVQALAELTGKDMVLPMNSGAEAVETAIKTARKWGYRVKGVAANQANIIVADGNFHGRTTTIVSFSTDPSARDDFGPFTPGFSVVPFGDLEALRSAITPETVAFLVEPIQGEAGVILPPKGYLSAARELCREHGVLFVADEIQSGLARTGKTFACEWEGVVPDMYILGKALGGGLYPLSAVAADSAVLGVFQPGEHGSTFGGNPLAAAIGSEVCRLLATGEYQERSRTLGDRMLARLRDGAPSSVKEIRGRGLWAGVEMLPGGEPARAKCERLMRQGVLVKDTHETTIRIAPPIVIDEADLDSAVDKVLAVLAE